MADLFDDEWMKSFQAIWNAEPDLKDALAELGFNSVIGYGFPGDDSAKGYIDIQNGEVVTAAAYDGQELSWDIRAEQKNWEKWLNKGIGMAGMGMAVTTGKMKFKTGDFKAMIKDPRMAGPFIKSFEAMGKV
ncbi:SCP-2 sterol transfer family protein [sulfur-oxidizing endosymbiont of Gigantopelta aegis]|uniref:SCP-2 sterol transfer family protein n=1 Tax=sulfur-oxidizing endosymbiont of Gigantopelta aegis TaxID=2794934 RepID=UPI0018DE11FA|nr:SCP-2 sterol transfer family protein [sulfur-oxidizing endosymbiont of Gigantopelta aegis]